MASLSGLVDGVSTEEVHRYKNGLPKIREGAVILGGISWELQLLATLIEMEKKKFDALCEESSPDEDEYHSLCEWIDYLTERFWKKVEKEIPAARQFRPLFLGQYWHVAFLL